ncbi:MAG: hypothetical protein ABSB42_23160 [Tepidisphaeraceae bacterium]
MPTRFIFGAVGTLSLGGTNEPQWLAVCNGLCRREGQRRLRLNWGQIDVAYTLPGDANLDGLANAADFRQANQPRPIRRG